jgi:glycine betaine catabolism B
MINALDALLDKITMYRLMLYYLIALLAAAAVLSMAGILHYQPLDIIASSVFLAGFCWLVSILFGRVFNVPINRDSSLITALILALIITPSTTPRGALFLAAAGGLAIASKYMLTFKRQHIFNPAAVAVVLTSFGAGDAASWWVGSTPMLPFVLVGGLLLTRKLRNERVIISFLATAIIGTAFYSSLASGASVLPNIQKIVFSSALFFLAFVMLIEPFTAPDTKHKQTWYGALVGLLFPPQVHFASFYMTPELALLAGNLFTFITTRRFKVMASLKQKVQLAPDTFDFILAPDRPLAFTPGQYVEWTLPHSKADSRGVRRYFTIASSPTEPDVRIGVKFYKPCSSFKRTLLGMNNGAPIAGSRLGGDFTLPRDPKRKVAFIAGGIGITPYRSMVKYLLDTNQYRDIAMLYSANTPADFAYTSVFEAARKQFGSNINYAVTRATQSTKSPFVMSGPITPELIREHIPDFAERMFYISGPHGMVMAMEAALKSLGVPRRHVKTDLFTGYA